MLGITYDPTLVWRMLGLRSRSCMGEIVNAIKVSKLPRHLLGGSIWRGTWIWMRRATRGGFA